MRGQLARLPRELVEALALGEMPQDSYVAPGTCRACAVLLPVIEAGAERWRCAATVFDWHQLVGEGGPLYEGSAVYERCLAIYEAAQEELTCRTTEGPASIATTKAASTA